MHMKKQTRKIQQKKGRKVKGKNRRAEMKVIPVPGIANKVLTNREYSTKTPTFITKHIRSNPHKAIMEFGE